MSTAFDLLRPRAFIFGRCVRIDAYNKQVPRSPLQSDLVSEALTILQDGGITADSIPDCVASLYAEVLEDLVSCVDMIDVEFVVDNKHVQVYKALSMIPDVAAKLMPSAPPANQICEHLDICTMGALRDKRESAALCAVSFDAPFDRIFTVESTIAISDIADCGRNFVHGLCTGRYGKENVRACYRYVIL